MYNKEIKAILSLLILSFSVYLFSNGEIGYGILVLLVMGLVVLSIFKDEIESDIKSGWTNTSENKQSSPQDDTYSIGDLK